MPDITPDTTPVCVAPESSCNGLCFNLLDDEENCGNCGIACDRSEMCDGGVCTLICPDQQLACGVDCVTPASNPLHCGECDQAYVKASNTDADDNFGYSISLSGDTLAVGAYQEDSNATGINGNQADNSANNSGAVYIRKIAP